jgi:uncharacterized iron-regulated membrane protein
MKPLRIRISKHAFVTFWDVHAWSGVLAALLLHFMFFFGAFTLFQKEIKVWEDPLLQGAAAPVRAADVPALLERNVPVTPEPPDQIFLYLGEPMTLSYRTVGASDLVRQRIEPATQQGRADRAYVGQWLDDLHSLSIPRAEWLERIGGGLCVLLGLALVTGVAIQLKDLLRQLFQWRLAKGMRVLWSDLHKVLGVWGLPFLVLFAWTGALLNLDDWMDRVLIQSLYRGDVKAADLALYGRKERPFAGAPSKAQLPVSDLVARAEAALPNCKPEFFAFRSLGHEGGTLEVSGPQTDTFQGYGMVRLALRDGAILQVDRAGVNESPWRVARRWLYELHYGAYGGPGALGLGLRVLYAFAALAACAVFLSGNFVWLVRRDPLRKHWGNRVFGRLNVGFGSGPCVATALVFVGSRMLPLDLPARTPYELLFAAGLALALAWAFFPQTELAAWSQQFACAALLFAAAPVVALRYSSAGLFGFAHPSVADPNAIVIGIDLMLLACAGGCGFVAHRLHCLQDRRLRRSAEPA